MVDSTVSPLLNNQEVALWDAIELQIEGEGGVAPAGLFANSYDAEHARISNAFGKKAKFKPNS